MIVIEPRGGPPASFLGEFTIGRVSGPGAAQPATYQLDDEYASVLHARVQLIAGRWCVEDLGTTNGTYVNGIRVRTIPCRLAKGDVLTIGRTELVVVPDPP